MTQPEAGPPPEQPLTRIQDLAPHVLRHRLWLGPQAASHGLTTEAVIKDIVERVAVP